MKTLLWNWVARLNWVRIMCRNAHAEGYDVGYKDGYDKGVSYGISLVPGHYRQVMNNLEDANADRARLTRELAAAKGAK